MDYGKSEILANQPRKVYAGISRMLRLVSDLSNSEVKLACDTTFLNLLMSNNLPINSKVYADVCKHIDEIQILYEESAKPPMPDFTSPNWNISQ